MILKNRLMLLSIVICVKGEMPMSFSTGEINMTSNEIFGEYDNFTCGERWSCKDYESVFAASLETRGYFRDMNCFCDHFCVYFQDCCPDAMINKHDIKNTVDVSKELINCVKIEQVSSVNAIYAVNLCPTTWSGPETRAKCEKFTGRDLLLHLTVTGVNTGLTYRNMYCAMCHEEEYFFWVPSVSCNSRQPVYDSIHPKATIREALAYPGCDLKFLPPNDTISYRSCLPHDIVDKCDQQFNETAISEICENSKSMEMVYSVNKAWRNPSCAVCNFESRISCEMLFPVSTFNQFKKRRGFYSFSILIDMNTRRASSTVGTRFKKITRNITEIYTCHDNEVYDPFSLQCRRVMCDAPFVYRNGLCRTNKSEAESGNLTNCPRIQLDEMEYSILENGTLLEIATGRRYDDQQYFVKGLSAFVCSYLTQNYTNTTVVEEVVMVLTFSLSEAIVSVVGLCISLIGLLVTIVTYAVIQSLQNIPGKNLLSLSSSLFIAELLMVIAPSAEGVFVLCKGIAVCMHYFFLVAFFWMNVMAADVWFTFSKSFVKAGGSGKSSKRFYFYSVYSWGVPFLILVLSLLIDTFLIDSAFKPDYGMGLCWFTKKNALMVFFAMPLFMIVLMNMIFFAIASKNIYEARRSSARHLQTSENSSPFLYMKLFFVMGLTWIVGFLASLVARAVLWYLFAILNTLQGFFIFLSFVATKKVLRLIRAHLRTLRTGQANDTNQPSSPTRSTFVPFKISSSRTVVTVLTK